MELIWLINLLIGALAFAGGFAIQNLYSQLRDIKKELAGLHKEYAKKEDVNRDFQAIQDILKRIEDKLDRKVDR